jgi:hypothetical protein
VGFSSTCLRLQATTSSAGLWSLEVVPVFDWPHWSEVLCLVACHGGMLPLPGGHLTRGESYSWLYGAVQQTAHGHQTAGQLGTRSGPRLWTLVGPGGQGWAFVERVLPGHLCHNCIALQRAMCMAV